MKINIKKIINKFRYTNIEYRTFIWTTREITLIAGVIKLKYINPPHGIILSFFYKDRDITFNF